MGNLGDDNFREFTNYLKLLANKKRIDKHILIGDINLNQVEWPEGVTTCALQNKFVEFLTNDLGHTQLIHDPTHRAGNTLDLLFTNIPDIVKNITILDRDATCLSDHFGITFNIEFTVGRKKGPKKKVYNYNKANWKDLNYDLKHIDWDSCVGANDPHISWPIFKSILLNLCDKYIPKRNVKSEFQPPWYDSECDRILRDKERKRKRARETGDISDLNKFRQSRREFKRTMNNKMRLNVNDSSDTALISKKFWNYIKAKSKSTRIPETIRSGDRYRNKPIDQANLFNEYFYSQFSDVSSCNIDINMGNNINCFMDLKFHTVDVYLILKGTNPSEAAGPDGIDGIILKNCAASIAKPLSLLFNISFVTGCIPDEWKLASVVPVHKKGDKGCVDNYRPISLTCLIMKVFERCIHLELYHACESLLDPRQHGFLIGKSCTTQMVPFIDELSLALNNKIRYYILRLCKSL